MSRFLQPYAAFICPLGFLLTLSLATAQEPLQELLKDTGLASRWVYTDVDRATAEARRSGKPLLVMFRCVPCQCAAELDRQISKGGTELDSLLDRFVCVRVVQMNGIDVQRFQFDRDLSLAVLFLNADGAVYGRYGTRATQSRTTATHISLPSFLRAMERTLELHASYPANRARLAGKRGAEGPPLIANKMPFMKPFPGKQLVQDCIHCHMVGESELAARYDAGALTASDIWCYPLPENLGLRLDVNDGLLVKTVKADSPAAVAGIQPGDQLVSLGNQPLISQGDIQWVLHHAAIETKLPVEFRRGDQLLSRTLELSGDWKKTDMPWRGSGVRPGLVLHTISTGERQRQGLPAEGMALRVHYAFGAAGKARIGTSDFVVAANGCTDFKTESELVAYLRLTKPPMTSVRLKLFRKGAFREVDLPLDLER
jgi:serine protease Do